MSKLDDEETELKGCIWQVLLFPATAAYLVFAEGWVLSKLWLWHAVPLGLRPLHWHTCAVVVLAWAVFRNRATGQKDDRPKLEQAQALLVFLVFPWLALLLGWWWA